MAVNHCRCCEFPAGPWKVHPSETQQWGPRLGMPARRGILPESGQTYLPLQLSDLPLLMVHWVQDKQGPVLIEDCGISPFQGSLLLSLQEFRVLLTRGADLIVSVQAC